MENIYRRVFITGCNGLLGQKLIRLLAHRPAVQLVGLGRGPNRNAEQLGYIYENVDLTDADRVLELFDQHQPTDVIHTAAMTNVDACERDTEACQLLNVEVVRTLCAGCLQHEAKLIHVSTDFIFDGTAGPYKETDTPNPLSEYGRAKLASEALVQASGVTWAIARTVLLYGVVNRMSRSNIVLWVRDSLSEGKPIRVVDDQIRSPTLAEDLADGLAMILFKEKTGIFHLSGPEQLSILEIAGQVADFWRLDRSLITPIRTTDLDQAAARPPVTGFDLMKATVELNYRPHTLKQGLEIVARGLQDL